jgi:hypothetical protein
MTENMDKWPSKHRKTEKSGHRLAAETTLFPRPWYGGMSSANLEVIWEMSVESHRFPLGGVFGISYRLTEEDLESLSSRKL